jgi:dihydrofolate reductase
MIISLIAAMAENRVIGNRNTIPWNIPSDQKHFREITFGHPVLFGRVTFEGLGRPLPGRKNIVLSRQRDYHAKGAVTVGGLQEAFDACEGADEVFICGGGTVFHETISLAHRIYLTVIHADFEGDVFFPEIPPDFIEVQRQELDNAPNYAFVIYERR